MPDDENVDSFYMSTDEQPSQRRPSTQTVRKPSDPDVEERIKLALTKSEKRFVDLELGLAELKQTIDKFKDLDESVMSSLASLPDLKQRVEDLEDLVMVESAGIEELKDVMETVRDRIQSPQPQQTQSPDQPQQDSTFLKDIQDKISTLDDMKRHIDEMAHEIATMKEVMNSGQSSTQTGGSQVLSARLENLKSVVDELIKRKVEIDLKIEKLDKAVSLIQTKGSESTPENIRKELDAVNRSLSVLDSRIDAIESVSKAVSEELRKVRISAQKFDSFEKASNLAKELQDKMEEFKFVENEIRRISNRVEGFYENIDQRLDKIREFERLFPQMKQDFDSMRNEVSKRLDENKISLLDRATKEETSAIRDRLSQIESMVGGAKFAQIQDSIREMKEEVEKAVKEAHEPMNVINIEITDILSRIVALETRLGNLERIFQGGGRSRPLVIE